MQKTTKITAPPCDCCGSSQWEYEFTENEISLGQCTNCGLHYIAQIPTQESRAMKMKNGCFGIHQHVGNAELHRASELRSKRKFQHFVELAQKFAPPGKWLDIGCGTGTLIAAAQESNIGIEGIELTPDRMELAQKVTGAVIYDSPIEELNLTPNSFAVVTLTDVFSHLISPARTFSYIHRVLQTGGILLLYTSEIGAGVAKHHNYSWDLGDHLYFLGERTIERYADNSGFELVYREKKWGPDLLYSRETFLKKGRSTLRNFIKKACVYTPGVFPLLRWYMLKIRQRNNPNYVSILLLKKVAQK
jgi:SAM-dependent methyltransferase